MPMFKKGKEVSDDAVRSPIRFGSVNGGGFRLYTNIIDVMAYIE